MSAVVRFSEVRNHYVRFILSLVAVTALIGVFDHAFEPLPAFGKLLSPFRGLWRHEPSLYESGRSSETLSLPGLNRPVVVQVDSDQIKHVFAENDADLYFAQGWINASERLWAMEFLARVAAGRISEIVGSRGLAFDEMFLRMGLGEAARESAELMVNDSMVGPILKSYIKGVNAYIASLEPARLPFEYKLFAVRPEPWTAEKTALIQKFMSYNLSGFSADLALSRSRSKLTKPEFDELFPIEQSHPEPVIPKATAWPFGSRPPTGPNKEFLPEARSLMGAAPPMTPNPANGSNNWAVSGKKSTTGLPILSNDIHLGLSLPSLWYEMQLMSPSQNVYGVSLPGAPGIVLGFNAKVAWAVTNGGTDVLDWYQMRYRDQKRTEYLFEGLWRPVVSRDTSIRVRGRAAVPLTLRKTHLGPIVFDDQESVPSRRIPRQLAMRWTGLEPSIEIKAFLLLNRARSVADCRQAIENYNNPAQNFLFAGNDGTIGIWHMGRFPLRWKGQGSTISDGSHTTYEWKDWIPRNEVPSIKNPARGYLSSANQHPTDDTYPHYLGWWFESPFRGIRINELLREKQRFSPEDFVKMQMDTTSVHARTLVPILAKAMSGAKGLSAHETEALEALRKWDFKFGEESVAATIFHAWWGRIERRMWGKRFPDSTDYLYPRPWSTLTLITDKPGSRWFDNPETEPRESFTELVLPTFKEAIDEVSSRFGTRNVEKWKWAHFHPTEFDHLSKIPGLGSGEIQAPGVDWTLFANQGKHGPVWKMVVALGPKPRAWSLYPGGQSGDPTSRHYDDFLEPWRAGRMKEVSFLRGKGDLGTRHLQTLRFEAGTSK